MVRILPLGSEGKSAKEHVVGIKCSYISSLSEDKRWENASSASYNKARIRLVMFMNFIEMDGANETSTCCLDRLNFGI